MLAWEKKFINIIKQYYGIISSILLIMLALTVRFVIVFTHNDGMFWSINIHPLVIKLFASENGNLIRFIWSVLDIVAPFLFFRIADEKLSIYLVVIFLFNPSLVFSSTFSGGIVSPILILMMFSYYLIKRKKKCLVVVAWTFLLLCSVVVNIILINRTILWKEYITAYWMELLNVISNHQLWTIVFSFSILMCQRVENRIYRILLPILCALFSSIIYGCSVFGLWR